MKILEVTQGSEEWLRARAGIPTASEFGNLVTPLFKVRTGDMVDTYLCRKLAEKWIGGPLPTTYSGGAMEQGNLREEEAIPWYEFTTGRRVDRVGFVTTDDGRIGCSPDGLFAEGGGIEVKCPDLHTHVGYLLEGELPEHYRAQVQGTMLVTGAEEWTFLSYAPKLPPLVLTVNRDEKAIDALTQALEQFNERLETGFARLVELNGDPPVRQPVTVDAGDNEGLDIF